MSTSSTSYKKVLLVGATSGIGRALADRFIASGSSVIVAGRRLERLNDFVSQHGAAKAFAAQLDLNDTDKLPAFVAKITAEHPDLDCVFLNSGVQNRLDFSKPESVDLKKARNEIDTNYWSQICMTHAFLPWLLKRGQKGETSALMFTSSGLAMVPLPAAIGYCATKVGNSVRLLPEHITNDTFRQPSTISSWRCESNSRARGSRLWSSSRQRFRRRCMTT